MEIYKTCMYEFIAYMYLYIYSFICVCMYDVSMYVRIRLCASFAG